MPGLTAGEGANQHLLAVTLDGMSCAFVTLDPATGKTSPYLSVASQCSFFQYHPPVMSVDRHMLYWGMAPGEAGSGVGHDEHLLSVDLRSSTITGDVVYQNDGSSMLVGGDASGRLIVVRWNGAAEEVDVIDPRDGTSKALGLLGDLHWWSGNAQLSPDGTMLYVQGSPDDAPGTIPTYKIYMFDLVQDTYVGELPDELNRTLVGVVGAGQYRGTP